jgi:hypothetical protein
MSLIHVYILTVAPTESHHLVIINCGCGMEPFTSILLLEVDVWLVPDIFVEVKRPHVTKIRG